MTRNGISPDEKQSAAIAHRTPIAESISAIAFERHYSVKEVAELWNLSEDKVRQLFEHEPDVVVIGNEPRKHKRRYTTLRIPQAVIERMHRRMKNG